MGKGYRRESSKCKNTYSFNDSWTDDEEYDDRCEERSRDRIKKVCESRKRRCGDRCNRKCCNVTVNAPVRTYLPTVTNSMKWWLAIFLGFLFFIFASPLAFRAANSVCSTAGVTNYQYGYSGWWLVFVLAVVYTLFIRLILW